MFTFMDKFPYTSLFEIEITVLSDDEFIDNKLYNSCNVLDNNCLISKNRFIIKHFLFDTSIIF